MRRSVYTYLVRIGNAVKIGACMYPRQRMRELGNPECLLYFHTLESEGDCYNLESSLHALFAGKRVENRRKREWFYLDESDLRLAKAHGLGYGAIAGNPRGNPNFGKTQPHSVSNPSLNGKGTSANPIS